MRRRDFIASFAAVVSLPLLARAQDSSKRKRIAILSGVARRVNSPIVAFERGLQELGYVDGQNIEIDYRYADGKVDQFPALARELIAGSPDVIFAAVTPATVAAAEPLSRLKSAARPTATLLHDPQGTNVPNR